MASESQCPWCSCFYMCLHPGHCPIGRDRESSADPAAKVKDQLGQQETEEMET